MAVVKKEFQFGDQTITLETGEIARQATSAVMISMGETVVFVTVVASKEVETSRDFFPLTVNYQEKSYAAGKIPGSFFKREGRPGEHETLISRLIDRPVRPLFPKGFVNEVQVIATVVSIDDNISADIVALLGTSAALCCAGVPFNGPLGAARVGYQEGKFLLNPDKASLQSSALDLVVAGTRDAVLMVESEAEELSEEIMLNAVMFGHEQFQTAIQAIQEFADEVATPKWDWKEPEKDTVLGEKVEALAKEELSAAYTISDKMQRQEKLSEIRCRIAEQVQSEIDSEEDRSADILSTIGSLEKRLVRENIINGGARIDGRDTKTVRPLTMRTGVLPRTHGSALFTRGETQVLAVTTLGTARDAQTVDALDGEFRDSFILHYNFPPYCVGETGFVGTPKRREIGHGRLAKRGIAAVMPSEKDFSYTIRVVSEVMESNGSSSMASVCGTSLSLMDAGVPIRSQVAGIAMGLIKEGDKFAVLTDILGDEDHLGDMDFKVAGTEKGVNALQMDIKIQGITKEIMQIALEQARDARIHILGEMNTVLDKPRIDMSNFAPRIVELKIHPDKIRDVIGKGGATIRALTEETGASIDISDEGLVKISSPDNAAASEAKKRIEQITADVEVGKVYTGKVVKIMDFGAFVSLFPGKDGLVHISQISDERVENVSDKLSEGETVRVKVLEVDKQGRIRLSMKAIDENDVEAQAEETATVDGE